MSNKQLLELIIKWSDDNKVFHDEVYEMPHYTVEHKKLNTYLKALKNNLK